MTETAIVHIVTFDWNDQATPAQIERFHKRLLRYAATAPGVVFFECGADIGLPSGGTAFGIVAKFESVAAFERYRDHPEHRALAGEDLMPYVANPSRLQFAAAFGHDSRGEG
jgi:hypothetical protein